MSTVAGQSEHAPAQDQTHGSHLAYGLNEVHCGTDPCRLDIVFVHGLTGKAQDTWTHKSSRVFWPRDYLRSLVDARVFVFGYDADVASALRTVSGDRLTDHARTLVHDLVSIRRQSAAQARPLAFVTHSLGGLVTKQAISHSFQNEREDVRQIEQCTHGVVFMRTPHYGSGLANLGLFGARFLDTVRRTNEDLVRVLQPSSEVLSMVEDNFQKVLSTRRKSSKPIEIDCFYEELAMPSPAGLVSSFQKA